MNARASISTPEVHEYVSSVIQRYLKIRDFGKRCTSSVLIAVLRYAAARITSLSDACARLSGAPSDETLRQALLATLPAGAELQRQLNRALAGDLPQGLLKRPQRIRRTYRRRFGIEASYRQMERARIRTSSRDPLRRLLFAGLALLLRNAWVWLHLMQLASRRGEVVTLHWERLRFTHLLLKLQRFAEQLLGPDPLDTSQPPQPQSLTAKLNWNNFREVLKHQ